MVATRIENRLRIQLFGLLRKNMDILSGDAWKAKIIQCIEDSARRIGKYWISPDQFSISIPSDSVADYSDYLSLRKDIERFVDRYVEENGFRTTAPVDVLLCPVCRERSNSIEVEAVISDRPYIESFCSIVIGKPEDEGSPTSRSLKIPGEYYIGRSRDADICLDSPFVSKFHFLLNPVDEKFCFIRDLNSVNGTYVNSEKIESNMDLRFNLPVTIKIAGLFELIIDRQVN